jgi:DNA modification methylase
MTPPWLDDGDVQLYHGDVIETLQSLPAGIAQTCVTSPPYWGLRDYGTGAWTGGDAACDHTTGRNARNDGDRQGIDGFGGNSNADGHADMGAVLFRDECGRCGAQRVDNQLGLEATPDQYVERIVQVFREVWRVLRSDGTLWLNLGDSYAGSAQSGSGRQYVDGGKQRLAEQDTALRGVATSVPAGLKAKDLVGVPWRVAFALQADGWYLRSDIVWSKPNPMPESVTDRPTKAHEYLFLLSKQPKYFWDADAIREPAVYGYSQCDGMWDRVGDGSRAPERVGGERGAVAKGDGAGGRNRRSVWTIATQPFPEAHFATYPEALVRPCVLAGSSERGECSACGAPWQRTVSVDETLAESRRGTDAYQSGGMDRDATWAGSTGGVRREAQTTGWRPSCDCYENDRVAVGDGIPVSRPQTILDPFIGSGTTALVARKHGRRAIGIDLSEEYLGIAAKRLQQLSLFGEVVA